MTDAGHPKEQRKFLMVANTSWYVHNFHMPLLKEVQAMGFEVVVVAPYDSSARLIQDAGIRYRDLRMSRRGLNPLVDLAFLLRLIRVYRQERPEFVFHHTIKPVIYGSFAASLVGIPKITNLVPGMGYVFTGQGFLQRTLRPLVELLYKVTLRRSHVVMFLNSDDREHFVQKLLVSAERSLITPGAGVDTDHFTFTEPRVSQDGCIFLILGRLLWDKGFGDYAKAATIVRRQFSRARFQILGKPDPDNPTHIEMETLESWVSAGSVEYLGERSDVRQILAAADVVVLPSYYREGIPRSLLEAMAMGKPIITTDAPGCRETVIDGANGILVPAKNPIALAEAMMMLIQHPDRRAQMGREGRRIVAERFSVERVNTIILGAMGLFPEQG